MGIQPDKGGAPQPGQDKGAVFVYDNPRVAAVKPHRVAGTGVIALPGASAVGGRIDAFTDKKRDKGDGVASCKEDVLIQRAFNQEHLGLVNMTRVNPVIMACYQWSVRIRTPLCQHLRRHHQEK